MSQFWNTYRSSINASEAMGASRNAEEGRASMQELQTRLDRMSLVCEALWTIVRDRLQVSEEDLVARVNDIDLSDGRLDGKVRRAAAKCRCGKMVARRFTKCPFCGHEVDRNLFS